MGKVGFEAFLILEDFEHWICGDVAWQTFPEVAISAVTDGGKCHMTMNTEVNQRCIWHYPTVTDVELLILQLKIMAFRAQ